MADFLEDDDTSDNAEHRFGQQEWDRLEESFVNAGYREGITSGKEEALQEGFDDGYERFGVSSGREIGRLRGIAVALLFALHNHQVSSAPASNTGGMSDETEKEKRIKEVQGIVAELAALKLMDHLPVDLEAMEHAKEHASADGRSTAPTSTDADAELAESVRKYEDAKRIVEDARNSLRRLAAEMQLNLEV